MNKVDTFHTIMVIIVKSNLFFAFATPNTNTVNNTGSIVICIGNSLSVPPQFTILMYATPPGVCQDNVK